MVSIAHLPQPGKHFVGRDDELTLLDSAWLDSQTSIVEFVAFGGVGKSALVAEWLKRMQADGYRGAARVFGHSFYSQGSREDAQASAESFLDQALRFFGESQEEAQEGSPWDKGERLARLVRQQPTLLILDGVEPLQSPGAVVDAGELRDPGLKALLVELAAQSNGLVVISTRSRVMDIEGWNESVESHDLGRLAQEAGVALLRELNVQGTDCELAEAVQEIRGHALSLSLVGKYVVHAGSGHISDCHEIGLLDMGELLAPHAGEEENRKYTAQTFGRIMRRYEVWLTGLADRRGNVDKSGRLALEIARLTGLFDRPITAGEFAALVGRFDEEAHTKARRHKDEDANLRDFVPSCENPPIPGLTELANTASVSEVNLAIGRLVEYGLIVKVTASRICLSVPAWADPAASEVILDAHPLIREYFAGTLTEPNVGATGSASADSPTGPANEESTGRASGTPSTEAVREAHRRLYEHLKQSAPEQPDNLNDMMPLYHAVAHGCRAGLQQHALDHVYWKRIREGSDYSWSRLGTLILDRATLFGFLDIPGLPQCAGLTEDSAALVLNDLGYLLRIQGYLSESVPYIESAFRKRTELKSYRNATISGANLCEAYLVQGKIIDAIEAGRTSVSTADKTNELDWRVGARTPLAEAFLKHGEIQAARECFLEAENIQGRDEPPWLYSLAGYRYCDYLINQMCLDTIPIRVPCISQRNHHSVEAALSAVTLISERVSRSLTKAQQQNTWLDIAFDQLTMAKLQTMTGVLRQQDKPLFEAAELATNAAREFRRFGICEHYIYSLMVHAQCSSALSDFVAACQSLEEACSIAERSGMKLIAADVYLSRAWVAIECGRVSNAIAFSQRANRLIVSCRYYLRESEMNWLMDIVRQ